MDTYIFYKSLYDRELKRREYLDSAINIPITILTILIGIYLFQLKQLSAPLFNEGDIVLDCFLVITGITIISSVLFLICSYNNFFNGFSYKNLSLPSRIRQFEIVEIPDYNETVEENDKIDFKEELTERIISITDRYTIINDKRGLNLYRAKTILIITFLMVGISQILISIN